MKIWISRSKYCKVLIFQIFQILNIKRPQGPLSFHICVLFQWFCWCELEVECDRFSLFSSKTELSVLLPFLSSRIFSKRIYSLTSFLIRLFNFDWLARWDFQLLVRLKLRTSRLQSNFLLCTSSSSDLILCGRMSKTALLDNWWEGRMSKMLLFGGEKWCKRSTASLLDAELAEASFWRSTTAWYRGVLLSAILSTSWLPMVRPSRGRGVIQSTRREQAVIAAILLLLPLFQCPSLAIFLLPQIVDLACVISEVASSS